MFSIDDRTGNVVTTVALFIVVATILYLARGAFLVLLLSILFSYLVEPAVTWIQNHSPLGRKNRTWAIAQLYLIGALALGGLAYKFGPSLVAQLRNLSAGVPGFLASVSSGNVIPNLQGKYGLSAAQQLRIQDALTSQHDLVVRIFQQVGKLIAYVAESAVWFFVIIILSIFVLRDGRQGADAILNAVVVPGDQTRVKRILEQVETMLAKYIRAQLALAGLSFLFYSISMMLLKFPNAIALGFLGGILEFLPAVGWVATASIILTTGYLTHSHWIWMAGLLIVWRLVQDYVNSPHIMGKTLELQPLTVVFALMVGAQVGGITGVYLSVPIVAALRIVWQECFPARNSPDVSSDPQLEQAKA